MVGLGKCSEEKAWLGMYLDVLPDPKLWVNEDPGEGGKLGFVQWK